MNKQSKDLLAYLEKNFAGECLQDEPLSAHTWYRIGGPADVLVYPRGVDDVVTVLQQCRKMDVDTYVIGAGANLLVSDAGFRGVIIKMGRHCTAIKHEDDSLLIDAGVSLQEAVLYAEQHGLGGLECLAGIPGTIGGALTMNAGTHCGEIGDTVSQVSLLDEYYEPVVLDRNRLTFDYRSAPEIQEKIILGCRLTLHQADQAFLRETRIRLISGRNLKQPLNYPSCGSVFKRPPDHYVGKMVQDLGLKGFRYGDAMISEKHGGFIVNVGQAQASHVMYLINKIQHDVYQTYHVELEPEVRFVGF